MFALQSSPPALAPPAVALLVLAAVAGVVGAVGTAVVSRLSNPVGKYRLLYAGVLVPFAFLAYGLLALLDFGPALAAALSVRSLDVLGAAFADFAELLAAGLVWLVAYAPTIRGVREVRDISLSTGRALARMGRYVVGLSAIVAVVIALFRVTAVTASPLLVAVGLAAIAAVFLVAAPWLVPILRSTREPTGEIADRIERLRARSGIEARDTLILDTDDEETANVYLRGPGGYRRLFLTSTFLDRFDDETATALLAVEDGRRRARLLVRRASTVIVAGVLLVASLTGAGPRWILLGASFGVVVVGFWLSRRGVRAADDYAASRVGADAVARAFERYAEVHALEPTRRRVPNPLSVTVALGDRIDRLRRRADGAT
ncbi:MAG: peptidase [Haloplanus sp.]